MDKQQVTLDDDVLAVFKRACDEGDLQVAEHLLQALEAMAGRAEGGERVEVAYLKVAYSFINRSFH